MRAITDSLDLQGAPVWSPDGQSITSAANDYGIPHFFRIPVDNRFVVYSGPDIGTTFSVKAVSAEASTHPFPALILNIWIVDLETGADRRLTNLASDFEISDFDISPDGYEIVLERVQRHSQVVLLDSPAS